MAEHNHVVVLAATVGYMVALSLVSVYALRHSRNARSYTSGTGHGDKAIPALLIGLLLMSEFIGTTASVGTAQYAYQFGISAGWNVAVLGIGFLAFSFLLARKYKELGENTISGVLSSVYGPKVKVATSIIMIFALQIVGVSTMASAGAVLAPLLEVDRQVAIVVVGVLASVYVGIGGMRSVIYTNVIHGLVIVGGVFLAMVFGIVRVGGLSALGAQVPPAFWSLDNVGWSQIVAWLVAGAGATFATQYVIQAIATVEDGHKARVATVWSSVMLIPLGFAAAMIGVCAHVLYPGIESLQAFPMLIADMGTFLASLVVAGLAAAAFGTISALNIGSATLMLKDFYLPMTGRSAADPRSLRFVRVTTVVVGLIPLLLALVAADVVKVTFLAKALRAALAVLVFMAFYSPRFGTRGGAIVSIVLSLVGTIGWFLAGNPWGIDNAYVALCIPLVVMSISHLFRGAQPEPEAVADGGTGTR
ncbi:sodium:solute symporter family protein [Luteimonas sp. FCS-9]|uniref:sodium:solute symporter family protein n=1 Tax=Luteimonas sp. FCS-9 TaxID=1547516 RepID=UPI00063E76F3|nr:sodium:solute symporter family protein [Luteimonas sp. FCS-9]KLJ00598.1 sodium:solute symporter [Luteimonas sp. FCS-9]